MADELEASFELSKIAKLNGDFRRNYGKLLGAFLYLRSISAARGRSWFLGRFIFGCLLAGAGVTWEARLFVASRRMIARTRASGVLKQDIER